LLILTDKVSYFLNILRAISRMSTEQRAKKIDSVVYAPVVSTDSNSAEAVLMREAKALEAQAAADTKYDAKVERFTEHQPISLPLVTFAISLSFFALAVLFRK
jgi:hypothetical protein